MKALLIDDEKLAREALAEQLQAYPQMEIVGEAENGFEALKLIAELKPDVLFLDVQMPKLTGFELLELLDIPVKVIFVTAYDQFAIQAFEVRAIDYLLKPIDPKRLQKAIAALADAKPVAAPDDKWPSAAQQRLVVRKQGEIHFIYPNDIWYCEADDDYVNLHTRDGVFSKKTTLNTLEENLPAHLFARIHRSYLCNVEAIKKIELLEKDSYVAILGNGKILSVSRTGYPRLKQLMGL